MLPLLKSPTAWIPIAMSAAALLFVLSYLAVSGVTEAQMAEDEGVAARIFQMLLAGQVPIITFFILSSLLKTPKQTLLVLALQIIAVLLALAPVFFFEL